MDSSLELLNVIRQKRNTFSKGQKKIADYVLKNYEKAAFLTASELGGKAGVSESTVVRFAAELGYSGYPQFQRKLAEMVQEKIHSIERIEIAGGNLPREQILDNVMKADSDKIMLTLDSIDRHSFDVAVNTILEAKHVYVVGLRNCSCLASFLAYYLKIIRDNVIQVSSSNTNEILEEMIHVGSDDAVVGISFPRYSMTTLKAMEFANDHNARIIAITDSKHSPMNMYSSCNLFARSDMASIVDSLVAPMSVINSLVVALCMARHESVLGNLEMLEGVLGNYKTGDNDDINFVNENVYDELRKISGI
jgi:DNA-binding MurR/RpiR family transcriptional regulator